MLVDVLGGANDEERGCEDILNGLLVENVPVAVTGHQEERRGKDMAASTQTPSRPVSPPKPPGQAGSGTHPGATGEGGSWAEGGTSGLASLTCCSFGFYMGVSFYHLPWRIVRPNRASNALKLARRLGRFADAAEFSGVPFAIIPPSGPLIIRLASTMSLQIHSVQQRSHAHAEFSRALSQEFNQAFL